MLNLVHPTFAAALKPLKAQGLAFAEIDTAALMAGEKALGDLSARVMAATIAKKAVLLAQAGASPAAAVANAVRATQQDVTAAFETNLRTAYGHGRYMRGADDKTLKYTVFHTRRDTKVRPSHRRLQGLTLPKEHPFWDNHTAPLGFGCRCITEAASAAEVADLGLTVSDDGPEEKMVEYRNMRTGQSELVPESADAGWLIEGRSPAIDPVRTLNIVLKRKMAELAAASG
jgi:uncharacterized protein with gpF-like domain